MAIPPRSILAAILCCFVSGAAFGQWGAQKPVPLDKDQQAIVDEVIGRIITDIKQLKAKYPELEHFGEKPWFTQGPGEFRYDYKVNAVAPSPGQVVAPAGGCGMYFSLAPVNSPPSRWASFYNGGSVGGARAGISHEFSITTDIPSDGVTGDGLAGAVYKTINAELEGSFERLAAAYVLKKHNVKQDTGSVIDALGSREPEVRYSAVRVLQARKLAPKELAAIREGFLQGKYPVAWGFYNLLQALRDQDAEHLPDFSLGMAKMLIEREKAGADTFSPTPFVSGPESDGRMARRMILDRKPDARFAPAMMEILANDQDLQNRQYALDFLSKLPAEQCKAGIAAGLGNSYRGVQTKAAEMDGNLRIPGTEKALESLLASPSLQVRTAARNAVVKLGLKGIDLDPQRPQSPSLARIADTLWQDGLQEKDVVGACSRPETRVSDPIMPKPEHWALPPGITATELHPQDENGKPLPNPNHDYNVELTDPWRMSAMDAPSVKRRTAQFAVGIKKDWTADTDLDATGQFLVAAAMKLGDPATAQIAYERLCDIYQTDDDILFDGVQLVGWKRLEEGLSFYEEAKDDDALKAFAVVTRLEKQKGPFTYLASFIQLARGVSADIDRRKKENAGSAPLALFSGKEARIKRMIDQLENVNYNSQESAIAALKDEGDDAVEPLLQCMLHDERLTRVVQDNEDHEERLERWVTPVRSVAFQALDGIFDGNFANRDDYFGLASGDPAVLEKLAAEVRKARDAKKN